eukprot:3971137-Lingulodinium_polyedra.AAC.1
MAANAAECPRARMRSLGVEHIEGKRSVMCTLGSAGRFGFKGLEYVQSGWAHCLGTLSFLMCWPAFVQPHCPRSWGSSGKYCE